jgi:hypothetical protein
MCANTGEANLKVLESELSPASGASVSQGAPVSFSGPSLVPVAFAVASSPALLLTPDVDSMVGVRQGTSSNPTYAFTSTKAAATPGTVYWTASFSTSELAGCSGLPPGTYTTVVHTLAVVAAPSEAAAPVSPPLSSPTPSVVSTIATSLRVRIGGSTAVELGCKGGESCKGRLALRAKQLVGNGARKRYRTAVIGEATFSIGADAQAAIHMHLNALGRRLLKAGHGRVEASLEIDQKPGSTRTTNVRLIEDARGKKKR